MKSWGDEVMRGRKNRFLLWLQTIPWLPYASTPLPLGLFLLHLEHEPNQKQHYKRNRKQNHRQG